MSTTIVFSHANGFPSGTYRKLFEVWREAGFTVHAIEKYGHDPRFPVTSNWPHLREQLIHFIEHEVQGPAWLVGHSMGGYLSLLAAARRPELASGVVLLDSPVISGWRARVLQFAKAAGVGERLSPGHVSKRRRQHWPSAHAAREHFAGKPAFARWGPGVLDDYIASGTEHDPAGQRLSFRREVETDIYNTLPHHVARVLKRHPLQCPLAFIGGSRSVELRQVGLGATRRLAHGHVSMLDGTHLFPFEQPAATAAEVLRCIRAFDARPPAASTATEARELDAYNRALPPQHL
jgi:pimeloyl-ACP methyl ester carboxylesterase